MTATVSSDGRWQGGIGLAIGYCVATGKLSVDDIAEENRAFYAEQFLITKDNVADFLQPKTNPSDFECGNVFNRVAGPLS
jgi:ribose transport system substrate-binding protein